MNPTRSAFRAQSRACARLGSPFMARLMALCSDRLAPGATVADRILDWPGDPAANADSVPLRLAGALHALKRAGHAGLARVYPPNRVDDDALWAAVQCALTEEAAFILPRLDQPPQTNEVRRSAALIPVLHLLSARYGLPIRLIEIGTSAGLNLRADRFRLDAGGTRYGPDDAGVCLAPDWDGLAPGPATPSIAERIGVDIAPLDPVTDADRLLSYVWPDQPDRIARTEAAIETAASTPATLTASDAVAWLSRLEPSAGQVTLVFHTIAWQYLPEPARAEGDHLFEKIGGRATPASPVARFAMEAAGAHAALSLQLWPGGGIIPLGNADYHGRWIAWEREVLPEDASDDA